MTALKSIGARVKSVGLGRGLVGAIATLLLLPLPGLAHHPLEGRVPATFGEGFLSGLAHPVIGLDHLTFVVAVGLLAAVSTWGIALPVAFVLAAMVGTGLHLAEITLPAAELVIAASVLGFGVLLALKDRPQGLVMVGLAAGAGLFHGFAYGEAIFGAQTMPLVAYLAGFTAVQLGIAIAAFFVGRQLTQAAKPLFVQQAGLVICGIGAAFLATNLLNTLLPA
ncbi:HupE/UreJ family protein [Nodosilinea sp. E11]|uniref:HupE/UreJ family protein n=1 Tax=Nodosilinea sp. E11 TaxID=3037479 RepID=UPI0029344F73|nr:HupE/UreJ family protein [Nodosilinea sp. E11]WOD39119.1 HupE/UreJ family protein [Nodosilinea sp. E11]